MKAIILFGHGARDVRWREPFDRLADLWREQNPSIPVGLAFLEMMQPTLKCAVASLVSFGATQIIVIPVFFGQGGHLRNEFPSILRHCQKNFPMIKIAATHPVGEDERVLKAILDFAGNIIR